MTFLAADDDTDQDIKVVVAPLSSKWDRDDSDLDAKQNSPQRNKPISGVVNEPLSRLEHANRLIFIRHFWYRDIAKLVKQKTRFLLTNKLLLND